MFIGEVIYSAAVNAFSQTAAPPFTLSHAVLTFPALNYLSPSKQVQICWLGPRSERNSNSGKVPRLTDLSHKVFWKRVYHTRSCLIAEIKRRIGRAEGFRPRIGRGGFGFSGKMGRGFGHYPCCAAPLGRSVHDRDIWPQGQALLRGVS